MRPRPSSSRLEMEAGTPKVLYRFSSDGNRSRHPNPLARRLRLERGQVRRRRHRRPRIRSHLLRPPPRPPRRLALHQPGGRRRPTGARRTHGGLRLRPPCHQSRHWLHPPHRSPTDTKHPPVITASGRVRLDTPTKPSRVARSLLFLAVMAHQSSPVGRRLASPGPRRSPAHDTAGRCRQRLAETQRHRHQQPARYWRLLGHPVLYEYVDLTTWQRDMESFRHPCSRRR